MEHKEEQLLLERQVCFLLYAAARRVVGLYQPFLKELGLTYTQYLVMLVLWEHGEMRMGEICARLRLDSGTLTPVLKHMAQAGLLTRERTAEDERVLRVALTPEGRALREKALSIPERIACRIPLSPEEGFQLWRLLYKVLDGEVGQP